jgi:putative aldouronate transport system permease protein
MIYLPHFLSWIILGGILIDILSPTDGIINSLLKSIGIQPIFFLGNNQWFQPTVIITDIWKEFGFGTIVYMASITGIDPQLYESAFCDGANWWQRTRNVTIPGMSSIIVLMMVLSLGNVLNAGFDQIFNLYSPLVFKSGDILDTLVYRTAFINARYSIATAVGLFKSLISLVLISVSYFMADRLANYRIF